MIKKAPTTRSGLWSRFHFHRWVYPRVPIPPETRFTSSFNLFETEHITSNMQLVVLVNALILIGISQQEHLFLVMPTGR